MASEMEKLARQFRRLGHNDIGNHLSNLATVARSRGLDSIPPPALPEGAQRFSLEIGGKTKTRYIEELRNKGIMISQNAELLLNRSSLTTPKKTIDLVKLSVADLGFKSVATNDQVFKKAQEIGLELVPAEVGPALRLADTQQKMDDWYFIAMEPMNSTIFGDPIVFINIHGDSGLWLEGRYVGPEREWHPNYQLVFGLDKPDA